jgi:hypothetical protein
MSYFTNDLIEEIEEVVRVYYADVNFVQRWNATREPGVLRMLTGYAWIERGGERRVRCGFKTKSVALRDAYYTILNDLDVAPGQDARRMSKANELDLKTKVKPKSADVVKLRAA